jgi:hypothetical protein
MAQVDYVQLLLDRVKDLPMFISREVFSTLRQRNEIDLYACRYQVKGEPRIDPDLTLRSEREPSVMCLVMVRETQTFKVAYAATTKFTHLWTYHNKTSEGLEGYKMAIDFLNKVIKLKQSYFEWDDDRVMPSVTLTTDSAMNPWHAISRLSMMVEHLVDSDPRRRVFMLK